MNKLLVTQTKILKNQDLIFDRLRDLEQKYEILKKATVSQQSPSTTNHSSNPNSLFPVTAPSPEWYKGIEDDNLPIHYPQPPSTPQHRMGPVAALGIPPSTPQNDPMRQPLRGHPQPPSTPKHLMGPVAAPAIPLPPKSKGTALESSIIDKAKLSPVETVVEKYKKLITVGNAGALAVKLAKESYFGEEVLAKCTVYGAREHPGLPTAELAELKQTMLRLFPQFWATPAQFETVWNTCITSINQCNKRLRKTMLLPRN